MSSDQNTGRPQPLTTSSLKVVVGICTCRNPEGLYKLLLALSTHETIHQVSYIVVDNDKAQAAQTIVDQFSNLGIRYVVESRAGIPYARNRIIEEFSTTDSNYLLMIDDDEYPIGRWIDLLVSKAQENAADVVGGSVKPVFENSFNEPIRIEDYEKLQAARISGLEVVDSTANIMLSAKLIREWSEIYFDERFAVTGGSDSEFLRRTTARGYRHAFSPEATVMEDIPGTRIQVEWLLRRNYRNGNVLGRITRYHKGTIRAALQLFPRAATLLMRGSIRQLSRKNCRRNYLGRRDVRRAMGIFHAFIGRTFEEYDRKNYRNS